MAHRPFRFAVQSFNAVSGKAWRDQARRVEDLGYSALHLADHFVGPGEAITAANHPAQELAAVPAMAAAAAATETLRVGCRVFCVDYRHPVILAKEAATLDLLSDGRLELGLGAGWIRSEYEAANIQFDSAGVRIDRLAEVVGAMKRFMTGEPLDIDGAWVRWRGFEGRPMPVQKPHPPIMIGGGGEKVLGLAGREADIVSLNFNNRAGSIGAEGVQLSTAAETKKKISWIKAGAGRRMKDIELEIGAYFTRVTDTPDAAVEAMASAFGLTPDEMRNHPHGLFGSVDTIREELVRRREAYGISYVTVPDSAAEAFAPVVASLAGK